MRLNGRDEHGFTPEVRSGTWSFDPCASVGGRKTRTPGYEAQLVCPAVVTKRARRKAREAAEMLGVEVPEWAEILQPMHSDELRARESEAARRRFGR